MKVEDLNVYNKLFDLALETHNLTLTFPKFELYELESQLRRSSNACPALLAEGFDNKHTNIYSECISRAQGELRETIHYLKMAYRKGYVFSVCLEDLCNRYDECGKMLTGLDKSLHRKHKD